MRLCGGLVMSIGTLHPEGPADNMFGDSHDKVERGVLVGMPSSRTASCRAEVRSR